MRSQMIHIQLNHMGLCNTPICSFRTFSNLESKSKPNLSLDQSSNLNQVQSKSEFKSMFELMFKLFTGFESALGRISFFPSPFSSFRPSSQTPPFPLFRLGRPASAQPSAASLGPNRPSDPPAPLPPLPPWTHTPAPSSPTARWFLRDALRDSAAATISEFKRVTTPTAPVSLSRTRRTPYNPPAPLSLSLQTTPRARGVRAGYMGCGA